jgi:ectoine hydroxylase-related dioxygenase (phytanoyl-CoA dioxygenase family)
MSIAKIDVDGAVASILAQGYAVLPRVLPADLVTSLADAVDALQEEDNRRYGKEHLYRIGQEGFVINVGDRGEPFERLLLERPVQHVVDRILGPGASLYLFQGVIVPPGGGLGAYPWKWHCDLYHVLMEVADPTFIPGINCLFFVDDVDTRNGGTWILPGSPGMRDEDVPFQDQEYLDRTAFQVVAPAGSVVMFNPLLWHCAGANHTDRPRRAVKMLMVREWLTPQMDYARSLRPEVVAHLDGVALRMLGHERRIARTFEELAGAGAGTV